MELTKYEGNLNELSIVDRNGLKVLTVAEDLKIPLFEKVPFWVSFIQPGSIKNNPRFKGHGGHFYFSSYDAEEDSEEEADDAEVFSEKLRVLPIGLFGYSRGLMPEWDSNDTEPICRSFDGIWPAVMRDDLGAVKEPQSPKCGTWEIRPDRAPYLKDLCDMGSWVNGVKPACKRTENWVFFDLDRKTPIFLPISGANISPLKGLYKKMAPLQLKAVISGADLGAYFVQISSVDKGTYRQMSFNFVKSEDVNPADYLSAVAWYQHNVLPVLGEDGVSPFEGLGDEVAGPSISKEDAEAIKADAKDDAVSGFEV